MQIRRGRRAVRDHRLPPLTMPSHKSFRTKITLAKAQNKNRYVACLCTAAGALLAEQQSAGGSAPCCCTLLC